MKIYDKSKIENEIEHIKSLLSEYSNDTEYIEALNDRLKVLEDKLEYINSDRPPKKENKFKTNFLTGLRKLNIQYLPDHDAEYGEDVYIILTSINRWKEYCFRWYQRGFDIDYYIPTSDYQIRFRNITYSGRR